MSKTLPLRDLIIIDGRDVLPPVIGHWIDMRRNPRRLWLKRRYRRIDVYANDDLRAIDIVR